MLTSVAGWFQQVHRRCWKQRCHSWQGSPNQVWNQECHHSVRFPANLSSLHSLTTNRNIHITELNPQYIWGGDAIQAYGADLLWVDRVKFSLIGRQMVCDSLPHPQTQFNIFSFLPLQAQRPQGASPSPTPSSTVPPPGPHPATTSTTGQSSLTEPKTASPW